MEANIYEVLGQYSAENYLLKKQAENLVHRNRELEAEVKKLKSENAEDPA